MAQTDVVHALSFDIEDWFHMVEIPAVADPATWESLPTIVVERTEWLLDQLDAAQKQATFFILGWIADKYPQLVRDIQSRGHEIGSHAYWHRPLNQLSPWEFREELKTSVDLLQQITGSKVYGFRAPSFSITPGSEWILDHLLDAGIEYDASLFPARRGHGGYLCPVQPHWFTGLPSGRRIPELPMSVLRIGPLRIPFSGGGYLRLLPMSVILYGFKRFERAGKPVVIYFHPRDFAPDCPRVPMPISRRFKCYVGLGTTAAKLQTILDRFRLAPCRDVIRLWLA